MPYVSALMQEVEFEDRFGDIRVIHKRKAGQGLAVKRTNVTPVLALNQEIAGLIGTKIRAARIEKGLTLAALCERAGLVSATPKSRMWEIENAHRKEGLRLGTLFAIAMALGVEVSDLLPAVKDVTAVAVQSKRTSAVALNGHGG